MSERRRMLFKEDMIWVRLDDLAGKLQFNIPVNNTYISSSTKIPIFALAGNSGTGGSNYNYYINLTSNVSDSVSNWTSTDSFDRIQLNAYTLEHVAYYSGKGDRNWTGRDTYVNRGWSQQSSIDVYGRGSVSNVYTYYSSDASKCYSGEYEEQKGTLIYFYRYQTYSLLSHFYALVRKRDYLNA